MEQKQKHHAKLPAWLTAVCSLGLVCVCASPQVVFSQTASQDGSAATKSEASSARAVKPATHTKSSKATAPHNGKLRHASSRTKKRPRGQQKIDAERAQAIQDALIREHYLSGNAAGTWNQASEDAMRRYQADHGWQSKTVPDSRALISLGLGPSQDHLLNPESAMTSTPPASRAANLTPASHSAAPGTRVSTTPSSNSNQDGTAPQ